MLLKGENFMDDKIAIMQPYFFPYIGYYSLIKNTNKFVFFDTPQYIRKGWINRNRIINSKNEVIYINVPVEKMPRNTPINKIKIAQKNDWKEKIYGQLTAYKKRAPHYNKVIDLVRDVIENEKILISEIAIDSVVKSCQYLDMKIDYSIFSKMNMDNLNVNAPDEWALEITKKLGYFIYVNPPGGKEFFDVLKYRKENIKLEFLTQNLNQYSQKNGVFVPGLSIIDIMMFCSTNEILNMMNDYILE
jgi:hypothetical protein